jgi:pyruvate ferredoxin oxidoreductase alpha subunit
MPAVIPEQYEVDTFLSPYKPLWILDPEEPGTVANVFSPQEYMRLKESLDQAMNKAREALSNTASEYSHHFGLPYHGGLIEEYKCDDAEFAILAMGALASEAKVAVEHLRMQGKKAGLIRIRAFRPFPTKEIKELAKTIKLLIVFDRDISAGMEGILSMEIRAVLLGMPEMPKVTSFIIGLGGVDVTSNQIADLVKKCLEDKIQGNAIWIRE